MSFNFTRTDETRGADPWIKILEDIPGGVCVAISDLGAGTTTIKSGTVIGKGSNGLFNVVKQAVVYTQAGNTATTIPVKKGHLLKVGNKIFATAGSKNYAITAIDSTTSALYDTITIGTTLGAVLAVGDVIYEGVASEGAATGALLYTPYAITRNDVTFTSASSGENVFVAAVVRGSIYTALMPGGSNAALVAALPLIRFVS
jgi:hypothetical protein